MYIYFCVPNSINRYQQHPTTVLFVIKARHGIYRLVVELPKRSFMGT